MCADACVPFFRISETAGRIELKFGMWLETHHLGVLQKSRGRYICTCTPAPVQMCPFSYISETAGRIALKICCLVRGSLAILAIHFTQNGDIFSSTRVTVQTFKHIYSARALSSPKRRLNGTYQVVLFWRPNLTFDFVY